jgi:hypothetical protein
MGMGSTANLMGNHAANKSYPYQEYVRMKAHQDGQAATNTKWEPTGYGDLRAILDEAYAQSAHGKGKERHASAPEGDDLPWERQPILQITRSVGLGFPTGQSVKKITEACGMVNRGKRESAVQELLGAIVYAAAAIRYIRETSK